MEQKVLYIYSDELSKLRRKISILSKWSDIGDEIGNAIQLKLVIDTNAILKDLRWMAKHRKNPSARTDLLECIDSETIQAYAPKRLIREVEEHLPFFSKKYSIDLKVLQDKWQTYKQKLIIRDPNENLMKKYTDSVDPNDIDFIVLAEEVNAYGILSDDKHIKIMGGHQVAHKLITNVRDYARSSVIALNIELKGIMLGILIIVILTVCIKSLRALTKRIPGWLIIGIFILALVLLFRPRSRKKITGYWVKMKDKIAIIFGHLGEIAVLAQQESKNAEGYLKKLEMDKPDVNM